MIKKILFTTLLLILPSCFPQLSPAIIYQNSSKDGSHVKNIMVNWNGNRLVGSSDLGNCGHHEQNFHLKHESDFFGNVHLEWENLKGKKLSKDIIFTKKEMPSFKDRHRRSRGPLERVYAVIYFDQNDAEIYSSDNPDIKKIEKEKNGNWISQWIEKEGKRKCVNDPKELQRRIDLYKKYPIIDKRTGKAVEM